MFSPTKESILIFLISVVILLVLFCSFIVTIIYKYQQRQIAYFKEIEQLKATYENTLLQSQIEIQEATFQQVAAEIHDNIGQKLTLAKLYLNTINYKDIGVTENKVGDSLSLISIAIEGLSDVSRSMSTDLILNNGLVKVIEIEVERLKKLDLYKIDFSIDGEEIFLNTQKELILFRIIQESVNNIIKHSNASSISVNLSYEKEYLTLAVSDNGKGFSPNEMGKGAGLVSIKKRAELLQGSLQISSLEQGVQLIIKIPINETEHA